MSVYNKSGTSLSSVYGEAGSSLTVAYDVSGAQVFGGGGSDYDEWSTEYQHTILQARDEWKVGHRTDNTTVPLIIHTDQHRRLRYSHDLFSYLGLAINWNEISATANLGDTCGSTYTVNELDDMLNCLSPIPTSKKIGVWGNHDCQLHCTDDSGYAYVALNDEQFTTLKNTYFDNSGYGDSTYHVYDNRNNEYVIDKQNKIKYCILSTWYYGEGGQPYYLSQLSYAAAEAWISMLSSVDDYDIIVLSHVQPLYYNEWYLPAVDGNEASILTGHVDTSSNRAPLTQYNQLLADRKAKTSGVLIDYDGNSHSYDFSNCTSDILCWFAGHRHQDVYQWDANGTVPVIILDAMGYDNHPFYMVNVDRTNQLVDIWKVDDSPTFYNFQIPFTKPIT